MRTKHWAALAMALAFGSTACLSGPYSEGYKPQYERVDELSENGGTFIESNDIVAMTDEMIRDILSNPVLAGGPPPRVIVDSRYFDNKSNRPIDKDLIVDRLRVELQRAARGRMHFLARERIGMVEDEIALKNGGRVDGGSRGRGRVAGADYRLSGRIKSHDTWNAHTRVRTTYNQISFEMVDLETSEIVWTNIYDFRKSARDDVAFN
jgi:hypothetical protein